MLVFGRCWALSCSLWEIRAPSTSAFTKAHLHRKRRWTALDQTVEFPTYFTVAVFNLSSFCSEQSSGSVIPMFVGLSRKAKTLGCLETPSPFSPKEAISLIPVGAEDCTVITLQSWSSGVFATDLMLRNNWAITAASCECAVVAEQNHPLLKMKFLIYETSVWWCYNFIMLLVCH